MRSTINKYLHTAIVPILTPLYLCFFLHHLTISISGNSADHYTPTDLILLNCGSTSTDSSDVDGRIWTGDMDSDFFPVEQHNNASITSTASTQNPSVEEIPYITARLSRSEFTYTLPVSFGPKFIRLYFYPAPYLNFDPSKSFFSVTAGPYTLLSNFSASLTADAYKFDTLFREFIVTVEKGQSLNITFTPSPGNSDAYAFINGIEVVSMPAYLYYSATGGAGVTFVGGIDLLNSMWIKNNTALEMVYRINVGGKDITPAQDSGMFRSWSSDNDYVTDARSSAIPVDITGSINVTTISPYTAPTEVYQTARTMGMNGTLNNGYKLTWEFPVDSAFKYFVRLHFCEFEREVTKEKERIFQIFIANQTAETMADIIAWTGANGVPIYKDYAVLMGREGSKKKRNLSIALHPIPEWLTMYPDAILNGLEIFKLSNNGDLAGPNPDPSRITVSPAAPPSRELKQRSNRATIIAVTGGLVSGLLALSLIGFLIFRRGMRIKGSGSGTGNNTSSWGLFSYYTTETSNTSRPTLPSDSSHRFSLAEIKAATNNFDNDFIIGNGGFGNVYKGYIDGVGTPVAIKRLKPESQQGAHEFMTEIEMLSQLRYIHLVSLIGYCNDDHEMILVYDYMARGTLRDHLYNTDNPPLSWKQRLQICIGAARGFDYLHRGVKHTIIHRDVKTTNILLDEKWVAKVSDFGLSKIGRENTTVSTNVKGTFGYLDPEYARCQKLTEKSDVYSFGVVLLEVLCAREPVNHALEYEQMNLAYWAQNCIQEGTLHEIIDPYLRRKIAPECFKNFMEITESCVREKGIQRPRMRDVMENLEFALKLQESADAAMEEKNAGETGGCYYPHVSFCGSTTTAGRQNNSDGPLSDSSSSGLTSIGNNVYGLSFPNLDSDNVTSGDMFADTTISEV